MGLATRNFILGFALALALVGCSAFGFRYYTLSLASYDGTLLGDKPEHDIPFSACQPTDSDKNPCVVFFRTEFIALKKDYLATKISLDECQRRTSP